MFEGPAEPKAAGTVIVEVVVLVIVETELVTWTISLVPDVIVFVTGQVVNVVYSLRKVSKELLVLL